MLKRTVKSVSAVRTVAVPPKKKIKLLAVALADAVTMKRTIKTLILIKTPTPLIYHETENSLMLFHQGVFAFLYCSTSFNA